MRISLYILLLCITTITTSEAQVPSTDLFTFQLTEADTGWHIHSPTLLSEFNPGGYTNQPEFITDDLLYVSVRKPGPNQNNDIYGLHLTSGELEQVTDTPEGEYSPTRHPDGKSFTCIREVLGGETNQQLFQYPLDRSNNGRSLFADITTVGYHCWLDGDNVAMFQVGDPVRLSWADPGTGENQVLISKVGRALRRTPSGQLAFVHKYSDEFWYLKTLDNEGSDSEIIAQMPAGSEDFAINSKGLYFTGNGSKLFVLDPSRSDKWKLVGDLAIYGIEKITRLDINSQDKIAIVNRR